MSPVRVLSAMIMALWPMSPAGLASQDRLSLDTVSIHLFLENSGEFSRDVTQAPAVSSWNFRPISEDLDSNEVFHSYLIRVTFRSSGEAYAKGEQARLTISEAETGTILATEKISNVYVGPTGRATKPVLIHDVVCGPLQVDVRGHEEIISYRLQFFCGE